MFLKAVDERVASNPASDNFPKIAVVLVIDTPAASAAVATIGIAVSSLEKLSALVAVAKDNMSMIAGASTASNSLKLLTTAPTSSAVRSSSAFNAIEPLIVGSVRSKMSLCENPKRA